MDGDFPRHQRYTGVCRVNPPFGSTPISRVWGHSQATPYPLSNVASADRKRDSVLVLRTHPVGAVVFSPSMIADVQANRERLSLDARWGSARASGKQGEER